MPTLPRLVPCSSRSLATRERDEIVDISLSQGKRLDVFVEIRILQAIALTPGIRARFTSDAVYLALLTLWKLILRLD